MNGTMCEVDGSSWLGASGMRGVISALLVEKFGVRPEQLSPEACLDEDLCLDSLELVEFGLMLQDQCGVILDVDLLSLARTLQDLLDLVEAARREQL